MESQRGKKKKKKKPKKKIVLATSSLIGVVGASCRGCHIAHQDFPVNWPVFGFERLDREAFGLGEHDEVPDMTMDEDGVLTVLNASSTRRKSFYISTSCPCFDAAGMPLAQADFVDSEGKKGKCATLILTLAPLSALAVCRVEGSDLFSHVSELPEEQSKADAIPHRLGFPLSGEGPFLCSQSEGGQLSHFGVQRFAVDLECPLGTLVVAVGDGQVLEVRDSETCRGPHAENLFHWNSIMLQLAGGPVVEYVHIKTGSALVKAGERVFRGQPLCETGDVGFCPVPHLHFQCHDSSSNDAPTVPFVFETDDGKNVFEAKSGRLYTSKGLV